MKSTYRSLLVIAVLLLAGLIAVGFTPGQTATAQTEGPATEGVFRGTMPVVNFDVSAPLRDMKPAEPKFLDGIEIIDDLLTGFEGPLGPQDLDPIVQSAVGAGEIPGPLVSFNGPANISGVQPPDPNGDVGPNHVVVMSNLSFQIFDKAGNSLYGPVFNNTLWSGFGGDCETDNAGDPIVLHDQFNDRWLLSQFTSSGPTYFNCIAISTTADPTGSYYRYAVSTGANFPDYPKYGVWSNAYYISTREFAGGTTFAGVGAYALEIADVISGNPAPTILSFLVPPGGAAYNVGDGLLPADLDGSTPPPSDVAYFMGSMDDGGPYGAPQDALTLWKFTPDFTTPANSSFVLANTIPITDFDTMFAGCSGRSCIPQPGTTNKIDILSYRQRPIWRLAYRNFGSHESLVTNQSVEATGGIAGNRWWEIRSPGSSPVIYQEGTYAPGTSDGIHRWMGSIAMDGSGNIAFAYSASDATSTFPSVWYTGRLAGDPLGQMTLGEESIIDGTGSQTSGQRWGDYSSLTVDPVDDCTFWAVNEWLPVSGGNWTLRIGAFKFDECGSPDFTLNVTPNSQAVCTPDDAVYNVNIGQVQGYTDPVSLTASGNPAGTSATFSVNPVVPPGTSNLTIGNMGAAAAGNYSIDVVGMAATSTHTATVMLDVFTAVPGAPTLVSPANGATGVSLVPTLEWNSATAGQSYAVEVATDSGFSNIVYTATGIAGTQHTLTTGLLPVTTYYWRVQAENICGSGSYSSTFSFTTADVPPILLVDDDDNGPDVQATYTAALDALGMAYDVWDTGNTDNEPDATALAAYDAVIWFSGDEFGGFAGPGSAGETALGTWLDAGGACLFLSSQDYHYDRDLTAFMTDYLGAATITDDNGDYTSVTGQGAVFGGLGPYTLTYPFTDYSDPITPNGTAALAFQGNNSNGAAITKETAAYKTTFWVYPWEAITNAADRQTTLQTFFDWCGTQANAGTLEGTVTDAVSGDPIAGATVDVMGPVSDSTTTNASGEYFFSLLAGDYEVTASASGYISNTISNVTVVTGTTTTQDFALSPSVPEIVVDPTSYDVSYAVDTVNTVNMTISNTGNGPLDWTIDEDALPTILYSTVTLPTAQIGTVTFGDGPFTIAPRGTGKGETVQHTLNAPEGLTTITHSATQNITALNSVSCNAGGLHADNSYLRSFTLADFGITDAFNVTEVSFGVEQATGATGDQPVTVNLYTWDPMTSFTWANFTLVGTANATVPDQNLTIFAVPVTGEIPAGGTLVVEVFTPDGQTVGNSFFIGSNADGQTAPSYLAAADCGVVEPTDTAAIGFPNMQIVMNVTGETGPNVGVCVNPEDISWVSVNPLSGTTDPASSSMVEVTFDTTGLTAGNTYTGTLCVESNDPITPLVTVPLTLTVEAPSYGVALSADQATSADAGETVTYTLTVTNTGNVADTIDLDATGVWAAVLSDTSVTLNAGESTTFTVAVTVPEDATDGDSDITTVTATSQTDATATDSADLTTTADVPAPPTFSVFLPIVRNDE